jgi:large conductance mechanosensitive channel
LKRNKARGLTLFFLKVKNKEMLKEFKQFAIKGNVIDLAVGVVIGAAFGKITASLVSDIIMPPMGLIINEIDFSELSLILKQATETSEAVVLSYGNFISVSVEFLIISFAIFLAVKQINRLKKKEEEKLVKDPEEIVLLREIRDSLNKK